MNAITNINMAGESAGVLPFLPVSELEMPSFDLDDIRLKILHPESKSGWTEEMVDQAILWYQRYMALIKHHPEYRFVPNEPIDHVWHTHILNTEKYARDTVAYFGHFLHHNPTYGLKGDAPERDRSFDLTNAMYRHYFGEDCSAMHHFFGKLDAEACTGGGSTGCSQLNHEGVACTGDGSTGCSQLSTPQICGAGGADSKLQVAEACTGGGSTGCSQL